METVPNQGRDDRKQHRAMLRLYPGVRIARNESQPLRFVTFTTSKNRVFRRKKQGDSWIMVPRTLKESFDVLKLKIKRATIEKDGFWGFKFNRYFCVRTTEGLGVLHVLFWGGRFIPLDWLRRQWEEIHGAFEVKIEYVPEKDEDTTKISHYVVSNYLQGQKIARMSYGWRWAWLGFCKSWKRVEEAYSCLRGGRGQFGVKKLVSFHDMRVSRKWAAWRCILKDPPNSSRQIKLTKFLGG